MVYDARFMNMALMLARRGLGNVYPNPAVGCVITRNGVIVGRGWTLEGGRPHAEVVALNNAGNRAEGATVYVTLEPCCHDGVTGPCTSALIDAKVGEVVIAVQDPDPRVSGKGIAILQEAGIMKVRYGILRHQAAELNMGFFYSKVLGRPLITAKLATTLDGKIATNGGHDMWITNDLTRRWVHKLRAMYDAILVGSNTVVSDDPMLDCRLPGLEKYSPVRVVVDRLGKLRPTHRLASTAKVIPTYVITDRDTCSIADGVKYIKVEGGPEFLLNAVQSLTIKLGITRLLVEGGGILITEMLKQGLVDKFIWSRANKIYGSEAAGAIMDLSSSGKKCKFTRTKSLSFGADVVDIFDIEYEQ
ncbi:MAG: bifunctional diaminohydroxyphosphoribosylaminopyrimidine deaminase/5-amino-6-(5-phosphoribosylamino)uracil reductase RibD [Aaplasma endosymbiont of Hyalomma asiaticum]